MTIDGGGSGLEVRIDQGIAEVKLARPDKRNALDFALLRELRRTAAQLRRDRTLRAVILSGQGPSFCAGIDLGSLRSRRNQWVALWQLLKPGRSLFQAACLDWQRLPVPVIAALHGHCFGAGLQLALGCDWRIADPDCQLAIMEARWGLVPDMGLSVSLRGLLRADLARELTYSARVIDGREAASIGLVSALADDPLAAARTTAQGFAERSPDAVLAGKRVLDGMLQLTPGRALAREKRWQLKLLLGRNSQIARQSTEAERRFAARQYD